MSENGARTLFFLVYVSFTLIIIHNQWTSGLIYRFSFFRSSLFFSFGQHLCFLVFSPHSESHTYLHHIFSLHRDIFRFYECKLLRHHRSCCPASHHHHGHCRLLFSVCATVPKCKFSRLTLGSDVQRPRRPDVLCSPALVAAAANVCILSTLTFFWVFHS